MKLSTKLISISITVILYAGCNKGYDDAEPCKAITILSVFPSNNAVQEPILIQGEGFKENTIVRFGQVSADIKEYNENFISTVVPSGLQGIVELSVQNGGDCVSVKDFEVIASLPGNLPVGPPIYAIPPAGFSFPVQVGLDQTLYLKNVYDISHEIRVSGFTQIGDNLFLDETFNGDLFEGRGDVNLPMNKLTIELFRPASDNTSSNERLIGGFYTMEMEFNGDVVLDNFYIAFSEINGRQYIFKN